MYLSTLSSSHTLKPEILLDEEKKKKVFSHHGD